jgi:hypothetical protein
MLVYGGQQDNFPVGFFYSDLWSVPLGGTQWVRVSSFGASYARSRSVFQYDSARDRILVYGGVTYGLQITNDTWSINLPGSPTVTNLTSQVGTAPGPRESPPAAMDPVRDQLFLFGSHQNGTLEDAFHLPFCRVALAVDPQGPRTALAVTNVTWNRDRRGGVIAFDLPREGAATIDVFDIGGRRWIRRAQVGLTAGHHETHVMGSSPLGSGIYFVRVVQDRDAASRKLVVVP